MSSYEIGPSPSLATLEGLLAELPSEGDRPGLARLRFDDGRDQDLLVDIWTAIASATLCRRARTDIVITGKAGGRDELGSYAASLPGLACAPLATSIRLSSGETLDPRALERRVALDQNGLATPDSDVSQLLVEFDPDYPLSTLFGGAAGTVPDPPVRQRLFAAQILRFRQLLDLGALRRGAGPVRAGPAGSVGRFLLELHENGLEHGSRGPDGARRGTRTLRMRTHWAPHPDEMVDRCGPFRQLRSYVRGTFKGSDPVTLVEASVSDFGMGIVDGFQASPAGLGRSSDRRELLHGLLYERLTSKSGDPSAGLGIQKALAAAESMQAFVSLRTNEFWMAASFLPENAGVRLAHLGAKPHPGVAGTHWQILWPQP